MLHGPGRRGRVARALLRAAAHDDAALVRAPLILDGHNDAVWRLWRGEPLRHLDLSTAAEDGFAGGFFALFPSGAEHHEEPEPPYTLPLEPPLDPEDARRVADEQAALLEALDVTIVRRVTDFVPGRIGAIMHLEGAEGLAEDLSDLKRWYDRGLRSVGIVWSRRNAFGHGVPFAFPSAAVGPGLTDAGRRLVRACNRMAIMLDVSHLSEAGFWDVAAASDAPLVATHSNAHALCASSRNLTDEQLDAIGASGGVVGINFAVQFLREDGRPVPRTPLTEIVRHVAYVAERIGPEHVAFGSDFEGAIVPEGANFPALVEALRGHGFDEGVLANVTHRNWLRVLERTWRPWHRYLRCAGDDPRATLLESIGRFDEPGLAVDLGCGTGRDTLALLREGWSVVAIDGEQEAIDRVRESAGVDGRLTTHVSRLEDATWPVCDLVNASFVLPFVRPDRFDELWERIVDSLRPGGRFSGQFFGPHDEWVGSAILVQSREEVERLLEPFEVERLEEVDEDGETCLGTPKHWHLFHVVARKR